MSLEETVSNLSKEADLFVVWHNFLNVGLPITVSVRDLEIEFPSYKTFLASLGERLENGTGENPLSEDILREIITNPDLFTRIPLPYLQKAVRYEKASNMLNAEDSEEDENFTTSENEGIKNGVPYIIRGRSDIGEVRIPKELEEIDYMSAIKQVSDTLIVRAGVVPLDSPESRFYLGLSQLMKERKIGELPYSNREIAEIIEESSRASGFLSADELAVLGASIRESEGTKIGEVMRRSETSFPKYCVDMIDVSEEGHVLDVACEEIGKLVQIRNALKPKY